MKKIGIKHILVKSKSHKFSELENILLKDYIKGENTLYVKVTYNRKTTQFKSLIYHRYNTIEEFQKNHRDMMIYELKLINFLMTSKIKKEGEDTSPKGIVDEVKKYNTTLYEAASKIHKNELRRALKLSNSKFKQFRLITENSFEKDPVLELEGYIKLFGKSKELLELYPAARILQNLLDFLRKNSSKKDNTHCLLWYYGDLKEKHSIYLRNKGMNEKEIINERVYIDGECGMAGIYAV